MTFKEWLTSYLPDYEDEYSGTLDKQKHKEKQMTTGCPLKFKELIGFLLIFFISGFGLGFVVAGLIFTRLTS